MKASTKTLTVAAKQLAYQFGQPLLRLLVLREQARVELILLALQLGRVGLVLEPGEDLAAVSPEAALESSRIAHRLQLATPSELLRGAA